jgi:hypothetical protein
MSISESRKLAYLSRILTTHQQIANKERPSSAVVFQQAVDGRPLRREPDSSYVADSGGKKGHLSAENGLFWEIFPE